MLYDSWKHFLSLQKREQHHSGTASNWHPWPGGWSSGSCFKKSESPQKRSLQVRNETKLANYFQRLVTSILLHSTGTPIHLIVVTEQESLAAIRRDLKNQIGRHLSTSIIRRPTPDVVNFVHLFPKYLADSLSTRWIIFRIRTDFVSLSSIVEPHRKEIDRMKKHFGHHMPVGTKFKVMMNHYLF